MEIKAVKKYKAPSYPSKEEILHNPQLLKAMPERWKGSLTAGIALSSLMVITLTACGDKFSYGKPGTTVSGTNSPSAPVDSQSVVPETGGQDTTLIPFITPVFIHGDGRGSFGCVSVAPPAFLSEEEAFQVVREEAEKQGLKLEKGGPVLDHIQIPVTDLYEFGSEKPENPPTTTGSLELDGFDPARKIGFEFISTEDIKSWHKDHGMMSSVESFDFQGAALTLQSGLKGSNPDTSIGVFYDPAPMLSEKDMFDEKMTHEEKETKVREMAEEGLRLQVRDFLDWLKAQGVI
jgi:hypothetical protein